MHLLFSSKTMLGATGPNSSTRSKQCPDTWVRDKGEWANQSSELIRASGEQEQLLLGYPGKKNPGLLVITGDRMRTESSGGLCKLAGNRGEARREFISMSMFWVPKVCLPDSLGETKSILFTNIYERNKSDGDYLLLINLRLTMINDERSVKSYRKLWECKRKTYFVKYGEWYI